MKRAYEVHIHYNSNDNALEKAAMIVANAIREGKIKLDVKQDDTAKETA